LAINLSQKYSKQIAELFSKESFVKGHTNGNIDFTGVKTVRVYMLEPRPEVDYTRSGSNRYGEPADIQDTVMEYTMTQDKAFNGIVDKGDESDQVIEGKAGKWLKMQLRQVSTPAADRYAFRRFVKFGKTLTVSNEPSKTNKADVINMFADLQEAFDNALVPDSQRFVYVPTSIFKLIATSDEFLKLEQLGVKSVSKGQVGELFGFTVIKVPSGYLPENCYALGVYAPAVAMPYKISETKIHRDPPGLSGALVEARHYYDAFVLGEKANGVVGIVKASEKLPAVTAGGTKSAVTLTCAGAGEIRYTTDGSDPRFSMHAEIYSKAFDAGDAAVIKAVGFDKTDKKFTGEVSVIVASTLSAGSGS